MNDSARVMHRSRRARPPKARTAAAVIATAILALLAAACGGSPSSTGSAGSPPEGSANPSSGVAYSRCVRAHGVPNFPDPGGGGQINKEAAIRAVREVSGSLARTAIAACANLSPAGPANPTLTTQEQQDYLRAAACMRSHGFSNFPDPTFPAGRLSLSIPTSIDTNSGQFTRAARTCTKLIPAGLPDSRPGGGS